MFRDLRSGEFVVPRKGITKEREEYVTEGDVGNSISLGSNAKEVEDAGSADAIIVPEPTFMPTERILHRHPIWSVKAKAYGRLIRNRS